MKKIKLTQGKVALVSAEDFDWLSRFKWTAHRGSAGGNRWYAVRNATAKIGKKRKRVWVRMHRLIMDLPPGSLTSELVVDHRNGNGLDNRRENLEVVTFSENSRRATFKRKAAPEPFL